MLTPVPSQFFGNYPVAEMPTKMATLQKDDQFYMTLVTIQVEDCLFKVPRQSLESQSRIFRDMFSLPVAGEAEGSRDSIPIRLEGVTKMEFKRLLQVLFLGAFEEAVAPDSVFDMWFPVVKLARMWEFDAIHKRAVQNMPYERISRPSAEKVGLAVHYDIQPWLLPAVNELARRKEPLGNDDLVVLGPELALKVAAVRESFAVSRGYYNGPLKLTSGLRDASMVDFTSVIKSVFQLQGDDADGVCAPETGSRRRRR